MSNPVHNLHLGNLVDLVAWDPRTPREWAQRTGPADWLGCVPPQYLAPEPVRIWRSVLNWFRAECNGLVVLSRDPAVVYRLLMEFGGGILAEDRDHVAEPGRVLKGPWPIPLRVHDLEARLARYARLDADILRVIRSDRFLHRPIASSRPGDEALWSTKRRRGDRGHSRSRWRIVARASVEAIETLPPRRSSRAAVRHYHKQATPHAWLDWHLGCLPMVKTTAIVRSSRRNSWRFCPLCIRERRQNDRA